MPRRHFARSSLTLFELLVNCAILLIIVTISLGGRRSIRNASTSLKTLSSAEGGFRANDRDWNQVNDFWTSNVTVLYTMTSVAGSGQVVSSKENAGMWLWWE